MYVNGMFSTYNNGTVDTSDNSFNYIAYGDSACCKVFFLAFNLIKADNSPITVGIYPASGYDLENQSAFTIYNYGNWNFNADVGFEAFPDTVTITYLTDSTISGTFDGTCTGEILNMNTMNYYDSVQYITNGKFNLKK